MLWLYIDEMIPFPNIDPVAFHIGPLPVRWYALAYIAGVILGWRYAVALVRKEPRWPTEPLFEAYISWVILGIVLGGRMGYVLFYNLPMFLQHPLEIFMLWHGGMSFHGGFLGVLAATALFCRRHALSFLTFTDVVCCVVPIGLFFGRIANFINGELFGRVSDVPWAMVFPHGGDLPRHPSQLYHAGLEGLSLLLILGLMARHERIRAREGFLSGMFLVLYGVFRGFVECFREPDAQIGFLFGGITMGQILCIPMIFFGLLLLARARQKHNPA